MSHKTWRTGDAARRAGAALAVAGASFVLLSSQAALAGTDPPDPLGNNGTVKIHKPGTDADDRRDEPKVCRFSVVAFDFDGAQKVAYQIQSWSGRVSDRRVVARSSITLDAEGHGSTGVLRLSEGHYKLTFVAVGAVTPGRGDDEGDDDDEGEDEAEDRGKGKGSGPGGKGPDRVAVSVAKHKVFKVDCGKGGSKGGDSDDKGKKKPGDAGKGKGNDGAQPPPAAGGGAPPAQPQPGQGDREGKGGALPITGRTIAAISGTGGALILAGIIAIILMRRRGIGPFGTPTVATAAASTGAASSSDDGGLSPTGLFGPLLGPGSSGTGGSPSNPPTAGGPPAPPSGPLGPPKTST